MFAGLGTAVLAIDSLDFLHPETLEPGDYGVQYTFVPEAGCAARDTIDLMVGALTKCSLVPTQQHVHPMHSLSSLLRTVQWL